MSAYPVAYNGSATGTGGDSLHQDLNIYYNVRSLKCTGILSLKATLTDNGFLGW